MVTNNLVRALLPVCSQIAVGPMDMVQSLARVSKTTRGERISLPAWTSLGIKPVGAVTEFL